MGNRAAKIYSGEEGRSNAPAPHVNRYRPGFSRRGFQSASQRKTIAGMPFSLELSEFSDDALRSRDEGCGGRAGQPAAVHQGVDFVEEGLEHGDRVRGVTRPQVA